jgi:hypothetical protein
MISLCPLGPLLSSNSRRHVNHFPCSIDKEDAGETTHCRYRTLVSMRACGPPQLEHRSVSSAPSADMQTVSVKADNVAPHILSFLQIKSTSIDIYSVSNLAAGKRMPC